MIVVIIKGKETERIENSMGIIFIKSAGYNKGKQM